MSHHRRTAAIALFVLLAATAASAAPWLPLAMQFGGASRTVSYVSPPGAVGQFAGSAFGLTNTPVRTCPDPTREDVPPCTNGVMLVIDPDARLHVGDPVRLSIPVNAGVDERVHQCPGALETSAMLNVRAFGP